MEVDSVHAQIERVFKNNVTLIEGTQKVEALLRSEIC